MEAKMIDIGIAGMLLVVIVRIASKYFQNKVAFANQTDTIRATEEETKLKQNQEMFQLLTNGYKEQNEKIKNVKDDIDELKEMIVNNNYMSTGNFKLFLKTHVSLVLFNIESELRLIVERNNINPQTLELTHKKIINFIERTLNECNTTIADLYFYKNVIKEISDMIMDNKQYIIDAYSVPISEYAKSNNDAMSKRDEALRNINEITKYLSNKLVSKIQDIMKKTTF